MTLLILGGRSLIGKELIHVARARREHVWELGRHNTGDNHILCDLSDQQSISNALSYPPLLDVTRIIFCHRYRPHSPGKYNLNDEISTMVSGPMHLALCAAQICPHLANIIFIGSPAAEYISDEQPVEYHLSRSALESMARYLAFSLSSKDIAVNTIRLGYIATGRRYGGHDDSYYLMDQLVVPRGYASPPEEVASVIDRISGISTGVLTGQTINLDAGLSLRSHPSLAEHLRKKFGTH